MKQGLTSKEAKRKLSQQGPNELPTKKNDGFFQLVKDVVTEPMFLLLVACGSLYILIGSFQEGAILLSTVFIIISITIFQRQ
jgi:Ca2+-transporting ATPase